MTAASAPGIGTLRERPLHASLKRWYAEPGDRTEVAVDGYVIDLVRGDLLIEVQTRGLSSARHKVAALLGRGHRLRVIYPIAVDTWIVKFDADGSVLSRRRSPRHGIPSDVFAELVSIAMLLADPHLEIDLVLIEMEERRFHAPDGPWRRKGWTVEERRLVDILGTLTSFVEWRTSPRSFHPGSPRHSRQPTWRRASVDLAAPPSKWRTASAWPT